MVPAFFVGRVAGISPASCRCMCSASFCAAAEIVRQPVNACAEPDCDDKHITFMDISKTMKYYVCHNRLL